MRNDCLDISVVSVGRRLRVGKHIFGVEDVQPLVFHRSHVEVAGRYDHEHIEIVFEAEFLLIPTHRLLERLHREIATVFVAGLDIDAQDYIAAGHCREVVFGKGKFSCY